MSNRLEQFANDHPEFFENQDGYWRLNSDIRELMDRYARAYDKSEYDRLKVLVEEAKEKERTRLQEEIDHWTVKCKEEQGKADEMDAELKAISRSVKSSEKQIEKAEYARKPVPIPSKNWYHSGAIFMLLALLGVTFIYLGIIFNDRVSMSYLSAGIICLVMGVYLQSGGSSVSTDRGNIAVLNSAIIKEQEGSIKISQIKQATLLERKRRCLSSVAAYKRKINKGIAKLNLLNE